MIAHVGRGVWVMTQQPPEDKYSSSRDVAAANRLVDHWPVYVALLPAILASAAITVAALSAAGIQHRQFGARQFQIALVITGEIASLSDLVLCCGPLSE